MEMANPAAHPFRLRLAAGTKRPLGVAAGTSGSRLGDPVPPARIVLTVQGARAVIPAGGPAGPLPAAVGLLRTVFEDHVVDPAADGNLFFQGSVLGDSGARYDFSVTHRGDAVLLSDFTATLGAGPVVLGWREYASEVVRFAREVSRWPRPAGAPGWARQYAEEQAAQLRDLLDLASAAVADPTGNRRAYAPRFHALHGHRKRPLELVVTEVVAEGSLPPDLFGPEDAWLHLPPSAGTAASGAAAAGTAVAAGGGTVPFPGAAPAGRAGEGGAAAFAGPAGGPDAPWVVRCRVVFGPVRAGETLPLTVNRGDVVIAHVEGFEPPGARLRVMGVGSGGLGPGDVLRGLQLYYP
ncbi:hypothetical protein [Caldinitratiruptor microaerophilus]|uniref:Uncharacterized protein n=1 Tax=Caldinitratiruptor microaerophilus TaxID=671077 RepID=A0AA35GA19_9FIRM|nr:hypothetical protein [Caldinitratiruptor microaerophilus]BDG62058.1 hypothetical protein caldi_31480 [Caldinitratiruptor microaerophilus]